jgi:hypothetical protein
MGIKIPFFYAGVVCAKAAAFTVVGKAADAKKPGGMTGRVFSDKAKRDRLGSIAAPSTCTGLASIFIVVSRAWHGRPFLIIRG